MPAIAPSFIAAPTRVTPAIGIVLRAIVPLAKVLLATMATPLAGAAPADGNTADLPRFIVPGHEPEMGRLEELHALHHPGAFSTCTLWDAWLPHATLWTGSRPRERYRQELRARRIDAEGYVSMQQHRGLAHSEGWPFPTWPQAGGTGWHFSMAHDGWAQQVTKIQPLESAEGWEITGADVAGIDPARGLLLTTTADTVQITTPSFRCAAFVAPFLRLEWAGARLASDATAEIAWLGGDETDWQPARTVAVDPPGVEMRYANVPLYRHAEHTGTITRYRITLRKARGAEISLKSLITAIDSRHPITNSLFVIGAADFFCWTGDREFLREVIGPLRRAIGFSIAEFDVATGAHVHVRWVGHDGRTGLHRDASGRKQLLPGHGVGNNYWDLLPFGSHDALATMMLHAALLRLAEIEEAIAAHPDWEIPTASGDRRGGDLRNLADRIRADFQERFWNAETGRFVGWIDADGTAQDYGFTFLNIEAIARGLASPAQASAILDWIDGRRTVAGDTAQGEDIYHWRFAPRSTTRRNIETYMWAWANPESIPWGGQVQDGGAVLGFSYFDLLARLDVYGPDDAWRRLREILAWFGEVQEAGGYRAYYAVPGRGTLQGGGTAGGLGFDHEFMESVLVPQVMLYGFMGFRPTPQGFALRPRLPADWPALKITGVHVHDHVLDIQVFRDGRVLVEPVRAGAAPLVIEHAGVLGRRGDVGGGPVILRNRAVLTADTLRASSMILVTGGAGFIGSNFVLDWLAGGGEPIVNLDKLTYAGNLANLAALEGDSRHTFVHGDIGDRALMERLLAQYRVRGIVHFAAESHVDRSIHGPEEFVATNVVGTFRLLEVARRHWAGLSGADRDSFRLLHVSTDEVYGSLGPADPAFTETNQYQPNSPYSASKAASDHLVRSYHHTYGLPVVTTNCSNNYGPFQFPEKLIPLVIHNALAGKPLPIYGDGMQVRDWLYVGDHCAAIRRAFAAGSPGEVYNVGGNSELPNIEVVRTLCTILDEERPRADGKPYATQITHVTDRPGHDRRYAIDARKIARTLGWQPTETFASGIRRTVRWYLDHQNWVANVTSGAYRDWLQKHYA